MSRVGKQEIKIPSGVKVELKDNVLTVEGPLGKLQREVRDEVTININSDMVTFTPNKEDKFSKSLWGTYASHVKNMVEGVQKPYEKKLILEGVGFKSELQGKELVFGLGFSHQVRVPVPEGITATAEKNVITISGIDKELVGNFAASVRALKKPEPYKGKGFRYDGEVIRRKQGKKSV
ncbi:50S ribosomal protein L6 [Candidatus Nomurabacteria bacterium]|nr:50S ribosomal protein L6 [Candidatus Nomurabacteria bacterium]USN94786.1 MAG: 50S ribosomal protein L6 [Candidatus Nomurabacteria bacterium]